jgi:hypothetical protein
VTLVEKRCDDLQQEREKERYKQRQSKGKKRAQTGSAGPDVIHVCPHGRIEPYIHVRETHATTTTTSNNNRN